MKLIYLIFFFTAFFSVANGQTVYMNGKSSGYIGKRSLIFQDENNLSFDKVRKSKNLFVKSSSEVPNFGLSNANNWIYFNIVNTGSNDKAIITVANPLIDKATLFTVRKGNVDSMKLSNYDLLTSRKYPHQYYLFEINTVRNDTVECFIKINSNKQILAPVSIENQYSIFPLLNNADTRTGIYLGIMLVMLIYNLFIYFSVRDKDYLVYCHYIFWVTLTQATLLGFSYRYLWPYNNWLIENMVFVCGAMSGIATILFAKSFLHAKSFIPKLNWLLNITILLYIITLILMLSKNYLNSFKLINATAALVSILIMFSAFTVYRRGYGPAKYFLLSWSVFFISILVFVSKDYGIVPYNEFTVHAVEIGSALEAILLSFALAGKINILKKEKEVSQAQALTVATENERIIREQNVILELKVDERTSELKESNEELNNTLIDLKLAQSKLIESEKMASLGQLTAGIAHEINNPINFVTSNISPLQRDVDILLEATNHIESIGNSDYNIEEKKEKISSYKESLDFDYLILEIKQLLKGMYEGASRTADIVKGLRIFSREDDDSLKKADVNESLESAMIILNTLVEKITITREYSELPLLDCYPGKLNQVYLNIITNSIHAIKKQHAGGDGGHLLLKTFLSDGYINVLIRDNGTGMSENTQNKLFEPFFTTKDVGEGTGLGMYISYNIIKKHNGEIIVTSKETQGTEFLLLLPLNLTSQIDFSTAVVN